MSEEPGATGEQGNSTMRDRKIELGQFHDVGRLFPEDTNVVSVTPDTTVAKAIRIMLENRYSQIPIMEKGHVRGVFSFWSLIRILENTPNVKVHDLAVEDVMETLPTVTVEHSLYEVLSLLERHEAVLVDSPHGLQAIATNFDVLRYFYKIARPFVLIGEIELALRALISVCAPGDKLKECINRSIAKVYNSKKQQVPLDLVNMTFEDYRTIVGARDNWPLFEGILGRNRELVMSKLETIRKIRNDVFHFKSDVSVLDHENLSVARDWLLDKARKVKPPRGEIMND